MFFCAVSTHKVVDRLAGVLYNDKVSAQIHNPCVLPEGGNYR